MKRGRKILAWVLGIVLLLIVIVVIVIATFDWNRAKPYVNEKVSEAIGRPFAINGDLSVHWAREPSETGIGSIVPWPEFTARDITVANPDWTKTPTFAKLDAVQFRLRSLGLLHHRIVIPHVQLTAPTIDLERVKDGRDNWTFKMPESTGPSEWAMELNEIGFDKGHIELVDAATALSMKIDVAQLEKAIPFSDIMAQQEQASRGQAGATVGTSKDLRKNKAGKSDRADETKQRQTYAFGWKMTGSFRGASIQGSGKTGSVLALRDATKPFPVQADTRIGSTHIAIVGTLTDPVNLGALDVRLWFSGNSMSNLYAITGITLPDTPPFATEGHLIANLKKGNSVFRYQDFTGRVGGSDLNGSLTFNGGGPRPKLSGNLTSHLLQFSDLAPLIGADSNKEKAQRGDATQQPADKALPVEPFRTDRWKAMDADVTFSGEKIIQDAKLPITSLQTHMVMDNGVLSLEPLKFGMAGGTVDSTIGLNGQAVPMKGTIKMSARHMKLKELFPGFAPMQTSLGELNGDAALSATGNSVAALLGSSNGEIKMLINDGAISKSLLEIAGLNVGNYLGAKLFGDKTVKINCAATDMTATNGLVDARLFAFDTEDAIINVTGTVDFKTEKLDLDIVPHTKGFRVFSLRSPLYVHGTLKNPSPGVHAGPLILRGGGVIAAAVIAPVAVLVPLIAPSHNKDENTCGALLDQVKNLPPKAPPAGKTQPVKK